MAICVMDAHISTYSIDSVEHINEILPLVMYILVDRGDLSTDIGIKKIPRSQKYIIDKAHSFCRIISHVINMTTTLQELLQKDHLAQAIPTDDLWLECDLEHDIEVYEACFGELL